MWWGLEKCDLIEDFLYAAFMDRQGYRQLLWPGAQ